MTNLHLLFLLVALVCADLKIMETVMEGNTAVITCNYSAEYKHRPKYFCKKTSSRCEKLIARDGRSFHIFQDNITLYDETEKLKFIVTINNVRLEDAGHYRCGINMSHLIAEVYLMVNTSKYRVALHCYCTNFIG